MVRPSFQSPVASLQSATASAIRNVIGPSPSPLDPAEHVGRGLGFRHALLRAATEILDRHDGGRALVLPFDDYERRAATRRVLELLSQFIGLGVDLDAEARFSEVGR